MLARGYGRIVNVSSGAGLGVTPMMSAYVVSKTALFRLTENLDAETRSQGVFVFAIDPGLVRSAMSTQALSCGIPSVEQMFQGWFDNAVNVPPERAARLVAYLASGKADVLSGRHFNVFTDPEQMVASANDIVERDLYVCVTRLTRDDCLIVGPPSVGRVQLARPALLPTLRPLTQVPRVILPILCASGSPPLCARSRLPRC